MKVKRINLTTFEIHGYMVWKSQQLGWNCDCLDWIMKMSRFRKNKMPRKRGKTEYPICKHIKQIREDYPDVFNEETN